MLFDILKDMVACWYASVLNLHVKTRLLLWSIWKSKCPYFKRKLYVIDMLGSIPHQKLCFYHLPTRGRAGIKLGDVDTSPTYLYFIVPRYYTIILGCFISIFFALSSGTSTNPYFPLRRAFIFTLCNFYFYLSLHILL